MEDIPELTADQLLRVDRQIKRSVWTFAAIVGLKIVADMELRTAYVQGGQRVPPAYLIVYFLLLAALIVSYVYLAIRLTGAWTMLGRNAWPVVAWFIALPFAIAAVTLALRRLPFSFLGLLLVNGLYASPFVILVSVRRELERRLEESTSLRSLR